MKSTIKVIPPACALLLATAAGANEPATTATAETLPNQSEGFEIPWYSMDSGVTTFAAGGHWTLAGTVGQFEATSVGELTGDAWQLTGGFWAVQIEHFSELPIFSDRFEK